MKHLVLARKKAAEAALGQGGPKLALILTQACGFRDV
jgi:hypothetical protein